ncbi:MAG: ATP-dependent Clp protease proteolytic subunit, partial [Deltaproteobacteria bacterium]
ALERDDSERPVYLFINSPGGEVSSGFAIFDTAKFIQPEVITVVTGLAASMGSLIALCAEKKNRLAFPNSKFLIHQPLISGMLTGSASEIEIHARDIVRTKEKINQLYAQETGRPLDEVAKATDRDNWMDPNEALDFGLISRIVSSRAEI